MREARTGSAAALEEAAWLTGHITRHVNVLLVNGETVDGLLTACGQTCIELRRGTSVSLIYRHAIAAITAQQPSED